MQKKARSTVRRLRYRFTLLSAVTVLSGLAGAAAGLVLNLTPLNQAASARLPSHTNDISSIIPGVLSRPVNILILGIDNTGHPHTGGFTPTEALAGNSDTMLLARIDPDQHRVNILSIPRDTLVQIPQVGIDKINDANVRGGASSTAETVSRLLNGIAIDRYVRLDTEGFVHLVDALGGLTVNVPKPMDYEDQTQDLHIHFKAGYQTLNGQHLQEYVRYRHDELGDIGRVQRQQEVLKLLLQKFVQPATVAKLPKLMQTVQENVDTDLSIGELLAVSHSLSETNRRNVSLIMLPGRFSRSDEYELSYWISDPDRITAIVDRYFKRSI